MEILAAKEKGNKTNKKMTLKVFSSVVIVLKVTVLLYCGQLGTSRMNGTPENQHFGEGELLPTTTCPGYRTGNPSRRDLTGCETGTSLDPIDHVTAFGFSNDENPDWSSCGIPELPEAK